MFTKPVIICIMAVVSMFATWREERSARSFQENMTEVIALAEIEMADTFACPSMAEVLIYLKQGLGEGTAYCSPLISMDIERSESLGKFTMAYLDSFDWGEGAETVDNSVEVFRVKINGLQLFAIKDMIDEHAFDQRVGLLGSTAYDVWLEAEADI